MIKDFLEVKCCVKCKKTPYRSDPLCADCALDLNVQEYVQFSDLMCDLRNNYVQRMQFTVRLQKLLNLEVDKYSDVLYCRN